MCRKRIVKTVSFIVLTASVSYADCRVVDVLPTLRPKAQWNMNGDSYQGIQWLDKIQSMPTATEVQAAVTACQATATTKATLRAQARINVKNTSLAPDQRLQAAAILLDDDK